MDVPRANPKQSSSFCSLGIFDCFSSTHSNGSLSRGSPRHGFEKEIGITHQQPHLVEPMKLTVWDAIPTTPSPPPPSHHSQWVSQSRNLPSRGSNRTSSSIRRKSMFWLRAPPKIPFIPRDGGASPLPRPSLDFEPLNLNIHGSGNRLSILPEFDDLSFTEDGEIKAPQRALLRTKSAEHVHNSRQSFSRPRKPTSLFEGSRASQVRHEALSRSNSRGRPSSEYHAISTTPPPEIPQFNNTYVPTLMQKDVTPPDSARLDEMVLGFPDIEVLSQIAYDAIEPDPEPAAPYPKVPAASSEYIVPDLCADAPIVPIIERDSERVSQWLGGRSHSSSFSTIKSFSTTSSFAEHRRKRFQFYQVGSSPAPPPVPLNLFKPISHHQRTMTVSTVASTIDTDIMSIDYGNRSNTSMTTASELQSRTGTVRSGVGVTSYGNGIKSSTALNPIASGVPDLPPGYNELVNSEKLDADMVMMKEIAWPLQNPAVGMAF